MIRSLQIIIKYFKFKKDTRYFEKIFKYIDFEPITNIKPKNVQTITFVIPKMMAYSGGHTSILRLGTAMHNLGYNINYVSYLPQKLSEMERNSLLNLYNYKGQLYTSEFLHKIRSDIWVATFWESVYYIKVLDGYKMYFIQDYEPYFYSYGEKYVICKKTYELGLHMVSLGQWNIDMVSKSSNVTSPLDYIEFPYEKMEYKNIKRNFKEYKHKKKFTITVYVKDDVKRSPYIIQEIMGRLKERFKKDNVTININYYGEHKYFKLKYGNNLGKLNKTELVELYSNSDFGLVFSLTNISLVPYEMIATGLPVIEFKEGTFEYFFDNNSAILTDFNSGDLYLNLKDYINNTEKIEKMVSTALNKIEDLSWEKTSKMFKHIIDNLSN